MLELKDVTLVGVDCVNIDRLRYAADLCQEHVQFGAVKLLSSLPCHDPRIQYIAPITSKEAYSKFIITELAHYIETPFALIIQYDGFILNPAAWTNIFLEYDYIGAPFYHLGDARVGNGGFSLRSKKLLDWVASNYKDVQSQSIHPEDLFVSYACRPLLEETGMRFAPPHIAGRFSFEGNDRTSVWINEFGFHGLGYTDISRWIEGHPEHGSFSAYKLSEFAEYMSVHQTSETPIHTLRFDASQVANYEAIANGTKTYEIRPTHAPLQYNHRTIQTGDTIVFKKVRFPVKGSASPIFKRTVQSVEHFSSKETLLEKYPHAQITIPSGDEFIASISLESSSTRYTFETFTRIQFENRV